MKEASWNEQWVTLKYPGVNDGEYMLSNYGRIKSFIKDKEKGVLLKPGELKGYFVVSIRINGKYSMVYPHKIVALHFLENDNPEKKKYIIHLDYNKKNILPNNLRWVSRADQNKHLAIVNPNILARRNTKLTEAQVVLLKQKLKDPNRKTRLKMLAKQFGISEMQLYRIKTGENWGNIG